MDPAGPDIEPVRVGDRRRRVDPLVIGVLVVIVGVASAVLKPWGAEPAVPTRDPSFLPGQAEPNTIDSAVPAGSGDLLPVDPDDPRSVVAMLAALEFHDAWGVRAVVDGTVGGAFDERWRRAVPTAGGPVAPLIIATGSPIRAIGVTAPAGRTPLAVRAWALAPSGDWAWLDARRPASDRPGADLLLLPPRIDGRRLGSWPAGRYRLDLLMGPGVERIDLTIDATSGLEVPALGPSPSGADQPASPASPVGPAWPAVVPPGPYAVVAGAVVPLRGEGTHPLTTAAAWLDPSGMTASSWLARTTGLGVLLPPGSERPGGAIRRLSPGPLPESRSTTLMVRDGIRYDTRNEPTPYVQFDAPGVAGWAAGTYALDLA
ncbi:hypothetical protein BH20CHL7_BH20CHL7_16460 [soil metagenome]